MPSASTCECWVSRLEVLVERSGGSAERATAPERDAEQAWLSSRFRGFGRHPRSGALAPEAVSPRSAVRVWRRELFGSFGAASGAKSTKKTEGLRGLELFGLVGDVGGANHAKDATAAACATDLSSAAPQDRGSVAAVDTACFRSRRARPARRSDPRIREERHKRSNRCIARMSASPCLPPGVRSTSTEVGDRRGILTGVVTRFVVARVWTWRSGDDADLKASEETMNGGGGRR